MAGCTERSSLVIRMIFQELFRLSQILRRINSYSFYISYSNLYLITVFQPSQLLKRFGKFK